MRKYVWYFLLFNLIIALINTTVRANIDCMDNSFHLNRACGPDFKQYHYVQCTCPCVRYAHSFNRGRCERCLHYRAPRPLEIVQYNSPKKRVSFNPFCNHSSCKK